MTLTPEQVSSIAGKIKVLQSEVDERQEAIDNMKAKLAESLPPQSDPYQYGDFDITVYVSKAFNAAQAEKVLPKERWEAASVAKRTTSAAIAKAALTEEEFALCQKVSDKTSVKVEMR